MTYKIENAKCIKQTSKAILVEAPEFEIPQWIPQTQIDEDSEVYKLNTEGDLIISDWLATEKGYV